MSSAGPIAGHAERHQTKHLLGASSALALFAGLAMAQDAGTGAAPEAPPAVTGAAGSTDTSSPAANEPTEQAQTRPAQTTTEPGTATGQAPSPADTATSATARTEAPATGPGAVVSAEDMMGRDVQGSDGESLDEVSDVIVDPATGQIQRLVIASGGFLGIGAKTVALDFSEVEVRPEGGIVASNLTRQDIERLPAFDVSAETAPLDEPPPAMTTTPPAGGVGAGGAVAPAPTPTPAPGQ